MSKARIKTNLVYARGLLAGAASIIDLVRSDDLSEPVAKVTILPALKSVMEILDNVEVLLEQSLTEKVATKLKPPT